MSSNSRYEPFLISTKENNLENVNDKTTDTIEYQSKLKGASQDAVAISNTTSSYTETNINGKTEDSREIETVSKDEDSKLLDSSIESFHSYLFALEEDNGAKYANLLSNVPFLELKNAQDNKEIIHREKGYHAIAAFLLKFLRAGEGDCEVASEILINYILLMRDHPQYYSSSLLPDDIQRVFDEKIHTVLPFRDKYGRRVFVWRPGKWNPASINFTDCYCAMYMLCEMIALEPQTQINGCTVVCDGGGIGFKQLSSMGIEDIRNCANFIQATFPLRFRQVHVLNSSSLLRLGYNMIKPFLSDEIKRSILFHSSLDSFHNHVDKEILPEELGGTNGAFDNQDAALAVYNMSEYFNRVHTYVQQNSSL